MASGGVGWVREPLGSHLFVLSQGRRTSTVRKSLLSDIYCWDSLVNLPHNLTSFLIPPPPPRPVPIDLIPDPSLEQNLSLQSTLNTYHCKLVSELPLHPDRCPTLCKLDHKKRMDITSILRLTRCPVHRLFISLERARYLCMCMCTHVCIRRCVSLCVYVWIYFSFLVEF